MSFETADVDDESRTQSNEQIVTRWLKDNKPKNVEEIDSILKMATSSEPDDGYSIGYKTIREICGVRIIPGSENFLFLSNNESVDALVELLSDMKNEMEVII